MFLKNLTALGFKSFAGKTSLDFQPGMTAIVGPNGCGKSNVSDAIRWVLGEQSAKALRGSGMVDVIFSGTDRRKALGLAEVSLTIGDIEEEHLKVVGLDLSYNEVTVTRRVFRDGGSEYFINKAPCRLRDVQRLFMGTGMGRSSYGIMAQGDMDQIISSKPDDRRMVFEEAAGITRFKAQKKEALRKLDYTEQNLLRVSDLIREVKRQIGSLQRQAGKARRYKEFMAELQHLETQLARRQFDQIQEVIQERQAAIDELRGHGEEHAQKVIREENEITQLRTRRSELEEAVAVSQKKFGGLQAEIERLESRIQYGRERILELDDQAEKASEDIDQAAQRRATTQAELDELSIRLEHSSRAVDRHRASADEKTEALKKVETTLAAQQEALRQGQSDAFGAAQQLTRVRNEVNSLDLQKQGNRVRLEKLSSEKIQLEEERTKLDEHLRDFAHSVKADKTDANSRRGSVEERRLRLEEIQESLSRASGELEEQLRRQAEKHSRLDILEQLKTSMEGFSEGTQAALRESPEIVGMLADQIVVPDEYVPAIEAALGSALQWLLIPNQDKALEVLQALTDGKKGRVEIAVLNLVEHLPVESSVDAEAIATPGGRNAIGLVQCDGPVEALLSRLLARTVIVPDLETAIRAWEKHPGLDFVTTNGEMLSRHGVFTGGAGSGSGSKASSLLARKNEIVTLRQELDRLGESVTAISRKKGDLQGEQTTLQAGLNDAQQELRDREVAIATSEGEFRALENSRRVLEQKIETVVFEIQSLSDQESEAREKRDELVRELESLEALEKETSRKAEALSSVVEDLRGQRDQSNAELTEARVTLATEEQLLASFQRQREPLELRLCELDQWVEQRRNDVATGSKKKAQTGIDIAESEQRIESVRHERGQVSTHASELTEQKVKADRQVEQREESLRKLREILSNVQEKRSRLDVELAQKRMTSDNLCERILQKYQVNLEDVRSECITITFAESGKARIESVSLEEMDETGVTTDWVLVEEQVEELQERIDRMGPVNLVAIEEYEETEERHKFLTAQHDDLVKAKDQLLELINRINKQTTEMFRETFEKIRANFRELFAEVFQGGKADLMLDDEGDVLNSGIEIVARPPGKKLQNISLLSGGEKAMTAVALLFSIYQVRPSPFCVLDELDAPLDDSNISRFTRVLKRFLEKSQFLVITHNKLTIGMADALYGVTMQEHGVSKIISVRFKQASHGEDQEPGDEEEPMTSPANRGVTPEVAMAE